MDAYKNLIVQALMSDESKLPVEVEDIFAVPDYVSLLEPCMDTRFGRYAKCAWTQLQWKFEAIPISHLVLRLLIVHMLKIK